MWSLWLTAASAHPVGDHPALHSLDWTVGGDRTSVTYTVEVPTAVIQSVRSPEALRDELVSGLRLVVDGTTAPLELLDHSLGPTDHGALARLRLEAPLAPGRHTLELSNGNLPGARGLYRTTLMLAPEVDLLESSLLVARDDGTLRSESGRARVSPDARRTHVTSTSPSDALGRLHRRLQNRAVRDPLQALQRPLLRSNRTTVAVAVTLPLLGLLAAPAPRPPSRFVLAGLAAIAIADLATASGLAVPLLAVAAASLAATPWRPAAQWWVGPALAASLDFHGASLGVIAVQLAVGGRLAPRARRTVQVVAAVLIALQALRLVP